MSVHYRFDIYGVTDTGRVRRHNEDCIGWDFGRNVVVLADGMGGHNAGDVASSLAVEGLLREYLVPSSDLLTDVKTLIGQLIERINAEIYQRAQDNPDHARMGTTLVMTCLVDGDIIIAHAGDSRVYRWHPGEIEQMTEDHSLVTQLIGQGALSREEAENSHYKHVITRALGVKPVCAADIMQYPARDGDVYLLCSDGLSNKIPDLQMKQTLEKSKGNWGVAVQTLVDLANQAGGEDNISVVLAAVTPVQEGQDD